MLVYLEAQNMSSELKDFSSVLIVACSICPPMCLAMQKKKPFTEFFKHGLNTESFSEYIKSIPPWFFHQGGRLSRRVGSGCWM
ncbi:MAG: hypothetical protein P8Y67_14675 [Alphaproteobacteria bacterium]